MKRYIYIVHILWCLSCTMHLHASFSTDYRLRSIRSEIAHMQQVVRSGRMSITTARERLDVLRTELHQCIPHIPAASNRTHNHATLDTILAELEDLYAACACTPELQ